MSEPNPTEQLREELHSTIIRYGQESEITVYQAVGVLEIVKWDLIELLEKTRKD